MKLIYCLMIFLWPFVNTAQKIKPLTIGDAVPDFTITNVYNYPSSTIRLSDLKGRLVILDFWATWCGSCIHGFPKLDSLQKKFKNKLRIMLVNNEGGNGNNEEKIKDFFRRRELKTNRSFILPSSTQKNPLLLQLFPHTFIPHYIWIGPEGKVIAITSSSEVSAANIAAVLNRLPVEMSLKTDSLKFHHQN